MSIMPRKCDPAQLQEDVAKSIEAVGLFVESTYGVNVEYLSR